MSKPSKLLSFARTSGRGALQPEADRAEEAIAPLPATATTNTNLTKIPGVLTIAQKKNRVATNLRLTRDQWRRVHELALDEETTVQDLAIRGLSRLFEERGLPRL